MATQTLKYDETKNYIAGKLEANGQQRMDVHSPLDGSVISTVPLSTASDLDKAVKAAEAAFPAWSSTPVKERAQIFFRYRERSCTKRTARRWTRRRPRWRRASSSPSSHAACHNWCRAKCWK
jgi:delta 1-pyrroline-5-carboxylate dehydrogenase